MEECRDPGITNRYCNVAELAVIQTIRCGCQTEPNDGTNGAPIPPSLFPPFDSSRGPHSVSFAFGCFPFPQPDAWLPLLCLSLCRAILFGAGAFHRALFASRLVRQTPKQRSPTHAHLCHPDARRDWAHIFDLKIAFPLILNSPKLNQNHSNF